MPERTISANGIQLAYEEFGSPSAPPIILIMGLATQMTSWPLSLCNGLADRGFRVIRFDNRDNGLSEKFDDARIPPALCMLLTSLFRSPLRVPYTLEDMSDDVAGLMDALGISRASIVGVSMGGMIGQLTCARHADRIASFTCIMSSSGRMGLPGAEKPVRRAMARRALGIDKPTVENSLKLRKLIGSPDFLPSDEQLKLQIQASLDRSNYPDGYRRQLAAIMANGSRVKLLKSLTTPSLIIHGREDPLVPLQCGIDIAKLIPNAQLKIMDGMGHDLPEALMPTFTDLIATLAKQHQ